jgi:pyruvate kinase
VQVRELLDSEGGPNVKIVAQIDTPSAIRNYHELLRVADAIMVSRTNLGMVIKPEKVGGVDAMYLLKQACFGEVGA